MSTSQRPFAVVTGGSSGIGLALARQFASNGFDVLIAAEDDRVHQAAEQLRSAGADVQALQVDLATFDGVETLYAQIRRRATPVDALALNAGVGVGGAFVDTPLEDDLALVALNITSVVHLAKRVAADMVGVGAGRILVTASVASTMPGPFYATYVASKAFLLSFAEAIRFELRDRGVSVTALMPGPTDTDFFRRAGIEGTRAGQGKKDDPDEVAADGFRALMAGDDHVVAGTWINRVQVTGAKVMPEATKAAMHARLVEPRSDESR